MATQFVATITPRITNVVINNGAPIVADGTTKYDIVITGVNFFAAAIATPAPGVTSPTAIGLSSSLKNTFVLPAATTTLAITPTSVTGKVTVADDSAGLLGLCKCSQQPCQGCGAAIDQEQKALVALQQREHPKVRLASMRKVEAVFICMTVTATNTTGAPPNSYTGTPYFLPVSMG